MAEYAKLHELRTDEHLGIKVAWIGEEGDALAFTEDLERGKAAILELGHVDLGGECGVAGETRLCWMRFTLPESDGGEYAWMSHPCGPDDEGSMRVVRAEGVSDLASLGEGS